jgi:hypothetical protein
LLSQFATGVAGDNHLCVFISQSNDILRNRWFEYDFATQLFPDFPKFGVSTAGYFVSSNEAGATVAPSVYVLDRDRMLLGQPARPPQRFTTSPLVGFGFQTLTPANVEGPAPPAGSPGYFMRHVDDELHSPPGDPTADFLEIYELRAAIIEGNWKAAVAATQSVPLNFCQVAVSLHSPDLAVR